MPLKSFLPSVSENGSLLTLKSPDGKVDIESLPIIQADERHRNFILSTWVRSYEPCVRKLQFGPANLRIGLEAYRSGESKVAEKHWMESKCVVSGSDEYTIHAWICASPGRLYHAYVAPHLRSNGVGAALISSVAGNNYHVSKPFPEGMQPTGHVVQYSPWLNNA
jgi:GNAT superfamily N-acetyltransferase